VKDKPIIIEQQHPMSIEAAFDARASEDKPTSYVFHYSNSDIQSHLIAKATDNHQNSTG
jgi:hypothetical protein